MLSDPLVEIFGTLFKWLYGNVCLCYKKPSKAFNFILAYNIIPQGYIPSSDMPYHTCHICHIIPAMSLRYCFHALVYVVHQLLIPRETLQC